MREPLESVINLLIEEIAERSKCMVFVLDSFSHVLLRYNFKNRGLLPYFTVRIRENEEFAPPRRKINATLMASKNSGCDGYIILISNGYQVNEFLQFAESERIINTQGSFLLMQDTRLFNNNMKYLWNRIINVIFIRRFSALRLRSAEKQSYEWFNLEAINYPINPNESIKTHYVDTWYKGKFRYANEHFPNKASDFKMKKLKVAIFEHVPAVTNTSQKYYNDYMNQTTEALGIEFEIIRILAGTINFKPVFYRPKDVEITKWGSPDNNGSYSGLLGEAVKAQASFFLGDLHYTLRHYHLLELSYPYNTECLTFLTPEALTENSWKLLIVPFKFYSWIAVILMLFFAALAFHVFALFYKNQIMPYKDKMNRNLAFVRKKSGENLVKDVIDVNERVKGLTLFTELGNSLLYTYSTLLQVSLPRIPDVWALKVFIGWWWLYSILVTVAYRASLTASLANPIGRVTIDTFPELAKSPIIVGGWGEDKKEPFISSSDKDLIKIGEKFMLIDNEEEAIEQVANGTFGYYENIHVLKNARAKRQLLEETNKQKNLENNEEVMIDRDLHIMKDCVLHVPIAIGMDKNSPLKNAVDRVVRIVVESGLVEKWLSDVMEWSKIAEVKVESDGAKALVSPKKLYGAFVALGIGYALGFIAFIAETLHWKYVVMKNPAFDKYQMDIFYEKMKQQKKRKSNGKWSKVSMFIKKSLPKIK